MTTDAARVTVSDEELAPVVVPEGSVAMDPGSIVPVTYDASSQALLRGEENKLVEASPSDLSLMDSSLHKPVKF